MIQNFLSSNLLDKMAIYCCYVSRRQVEQGYALFKQIELLWEKKYMLKLLVRQDNFNLVLPFKSILHQKYWKNKQKTIKTASFAISFTSFLVFLSFFKVNCWVKILKNHLVLVRAVKNITFYSKNYIFEKKIAWPFLFKEWMPLLKLIFSI